MPTEATLFTVFLRIPEGALQRILVSTGVYAEPRGDMPRAGWQVQGHLAARSHTG